MTFPVTDRRLVGGNPARGGRRLASQNPPPVKRRGKTPSEFCIAWGISLSTFENWQRKGIGPRVRQPAGRGGHRWITEEAENDWAQQSSAAQ
jgi:hypothetical protein